MPETAAAPRFRLLFLDLDGTLVGREDVVSPRTVAALNAAVAAGCTPVICTARNRYMVRNVAVQWNGHGYTVLNNGAILAEWETGRVLQKITLPPPIVREAVRVARDHEISALLFGVHAEEDGGERIYTDGQFPLPAAHLAQNAHRLVHRPDLATADDLLPVGMGAYGPAEPIQTLAAAWQDTLGTEVAVFASPVPKYDCWCIFMNAREADKAHAAARVAEMLGIPREQTLAIGDHLNDLGMLRWAGLGVCMGDGHPDAQACADQVTGTQSEDGVAQAIERFVLGMTQAVP